MHECPRCRKESAAGVNYCPWCGCSLIGSSAVSAVAVEAGQAAAGESGPGSAGTGTVVDVEPLASDSSPRSTLSNAADSSELHPEVPAAVSSVKVSPPGATVCAPPQTGAVQPPPISDGKSKVRTASPLVPDSNPETPLIQPRLVVIRGQNLRQEYPIYEGRNTVGRFADRPVDIDLVGQEAEGQVWSSRFHAAIIFARGEVRVEDMNSLNGTWLNGLRIQPGQQRLIKPGDVLQIGTVQLRLVID